MGQAAAHASSARNLHQHAQYQGAGRQQFAAHLYPLHQSVLCGARGLAPMGQGAAGMALVRNLNRPRRHGDGARGTHAHADRRFELIAGSPQVVPAWAGTTRSAGLPRLNGAGTISVSRHGRSLRRLVSMTGPSSVAPGLSGGSIDSCLPNSWRMLTAVIAQSASDEAIDFR